jgi:hypothetical protein
MSATKFVALCVLMGVCVIMVYLLVSPESKVGRFGGVRSEGELRGEEYQDSALGFAFTYPADWTKAEEPRLGADVTFFGPRRSEFTMSLDVRSEVNPTALNVYVDRSIKKMLPDYKTNFKLLEEGPLALEATGVDAVKVAYTSREGQFDLTTVHAVYDMENRKVVVSFCLLSEHYEELKLAVEQTLKSFRRL